MRAFKLLVILLALLPLASCGGYGRYRTDFYDLFDTHTVVTAYVKSEREFDALAGALHDEMLRLHRLYDVYNDYEGVNNIKTVNDAAGKAPVAVDGDVIELLKFCLYAEAETGGAVNAAMGPVLKLWHEYRDAGLLNPTQAELPSTEELERLAQLTDIGKLVIDEEQSTAFLTEAGMSLDVGALAKGFAAQKAATKIRALGFGSFLISAGGNVLAVGAPEEAGRKSWSVGVQNPDTSSDELYDTLSAKDISLVTSGDYQRFYTVGGKNYCHIIDPETLMPANRFRAVSVLHADSGLADMLSTALFILPLEDGKSLLSRFSGEALWIMPDGSNFATDGYRALSEKFRR